MATPPLSPWSVSLPDSDPKGPRTLHYDDGHRRFSVAMTLAEAVRLASLVTMGDDGITPVALERAAQARIQRSQAIPHTA